MALDLFVRVVWGQVLYLFELGLRSHSASPALSVEVWAALTLRGGGAGVYVCV